ncbi:SCO family protein [Sediminibacterium soli]|uniref:SCO family protein n=1 Tax=Sediminibacterium soli TaxID=2698829 RepID=UPI0013794DEF|nr:SCO family protein [Sediminibacterium soli]NCI45348.1 SCO family protein [Sediminibacterium soli]
MTKALVFACMTAGFTACHSPEKAKPSVQKLPYYRSADFTPLFADTVPDNFHRIPAFTLTAHTGKPVTEKDLDGKITVADFFFTACPGICPRMTTNMKLLQDSFLHETHVQLLSHSVTPDRDSVSVLRAYAQKKGVNEKRWLLLTGDKKNIYDLGRKYYFVEEDMGLKKDSSEFLHTENFILLDGRRRIRGIYNGLSLASMQNLIADIRELLKTL